MPIERCARSVLPDERSGGTAAVQLLADAGHRDIGLLGYDFRSGLGGSESTADEETLVEMPVVERGSIDPYRHSRKRAGQVGGSDPSGGTRGGD
jgi:DNA-binding LacI/PurR family transcriptional regulator